MRKITIYQEGEAIRLFDDNSSSIQEASKELTKLMHSNNVSVLVTTAAALIIRPSKINSILIEDLNIDDEDDSDDSLLVDTVKDMVNETPPSSNQEVDVITDV
jgi:hypothetical protein